jgi:hypothetical protein
MLRDNPVGSSHRCLENPRPNGAELSLTEDVTSPFQAEPAQPDHADIGHRGPSTNFSDYGSFNQACGSIPSSPFRGRDRQGKKNISFESEKKRGLEPIGHEGFRPPFLMCSQL